MVWVIRDKIQTLDLSLVVWKTEKSSEHGVKSGLDNGGH
jgi:hypothetical protein